MQLQCAKCREPLSGKVLFCPFCGAPQETGRTTTNDKPSSKPAPSPDNAHKPPPIPLQPLESAVPSPIPATEGLGNTTPARTSAAVPPPIPVATPPTATTAPVAPNLPVSPSSSSASSSSSSLPPSPPPKEQKSNGCLGCAGFAVLALAIAAIAGYFYITSWLKKIELAELNVATQAYITAGDITNAEAAIEKIRNLDAESSLIRTNTEKIIAARKSAVDALKKSQSALQNRDLNTARAALASAAKLDRTTPQLTTQDTAIKAREKLRDQALEAMRKCLGVNDFACGKTQANNASRIDKSFDAMAEFTKAEVAYRDAQNNPIQSGWNTILEATANAIVRAATDKGDTNSPPSPPARATNPPRTSASALPDCDQLLLQSKNAKQNRRYDEAVQTAEAALAFSPVCEGAQEALDSALTARRRAKQLAR